MRGALLAATLCVIGALLAVPAPVEAQALSTLHITVSLIDATGKSTPVVRHALLISEEPPTTAPRRVLTTLTGTAEVKLRPGHYAIASDQPVGFEGKSYEWSQRLDIVAGRDATLELTAANASVGSAVGTATAAATSATPSEWDPVLLESRWQGSVVGLWTPTRRASGFVVDPRGLIVTSQRVLSTATSVEAQLSPTVRVRATVLAADPTRDVAVLRVNPSVVTQVRPLPLACGQPRPSAANGAELYSLGVEMTGQTRLARGEVTGVGPRLFLSDLAFAAASAGGPVFTEGGLVGFTTVDDRDPDARSDARVVRIDQACELMASAENKMAEVMAPAATPLPADPPPVAVSALNDAVKARAGSLNPYAMSTAGFDVNFITPVHLYGAKDRVQGAATDFGNWSEYLSGYPRALVVRVTPKMAEGLWSKVARGAAMTQGMALPPMKHAGAGFLRMRAFCGDAEVAPIHPFVIEHRTSETEGIVEGLYLFDPAAFGASCGTVKLTISSEREPDKSDTRVVDPKILEQIARDFAGL